MIFDYRSSSCSHKESIMNKSKVRVMVFKATFNNISVKLWWSALLMEETRLPRENHQPAKLDPIMLYRVHLA